MNIPAASGATPSGPSAPSGAPSGVEPDAPAGASAASSPSSAPIAVRPGRTRLIQAALSDQTDGRAELLQESQWLAHTAEADLRLAGNAFAVEDTLGGRGTAYVKIAPLPHARSQKSEWDLRLQHGEALTLSSGDGYSWEKAPYAGEPSDLKWNRIAALHALQRSLRPFEAGRDGLPLSNTWGDRSRDAHLNPQFMAREIEAAARLGVDIVQVDDGWQHGVTANSARANGGGAWNGFWASDPDFWSVNRERFPQGLAPLVQAAKAHGMKFGLWFAPDTSGNGANWKRDAQAILNLHRSEGVDYFKIDALKIESKEGEASLRSFLGMVRLESRGRITFDLDITAEKRFGYFGAIEAGPLFVENRYTDWHRYWPHATLRTLWQLSHWIDPLRLRLEWLNNARNVEKYGDDLLAPSKWQPDALFATVMAASPLGWFEAQHLPASYFERASPLISTWKQHRAAWFRGTTLPIGEAPDGFAWAGFASLSPQREAAYVLAFRELNSSADWAVEVPLLKRADAKAAPQVLAGSGRARMEGRTLRVEGVERLGFVWVKV